MFAEKMTKVINCQKWIVFKSLEPLMTKPGYNVNRSITNNCRLSKKLLYLNYNATCVNSTRRCYAVLQRVTENAHAYQVMSNLSAYSNSLSPTLAISEDSKIDNVDTLIEKQWISMSNSEILENFKILSHYAHQNSEDMNHLKYRGLFYILAERCSKFSYEELSDMLSMLHLWDTRGLVRSNLWRPLDKACVNIMPNLTKEQIFLISDHLYRLNVAPQSDCVFHALRKILPKDMTPANLVQYAFLMKVKGKLDVVDLKKFEYFVQKNIDDLSVEELGIICMSFFKYQTPIRSNKLFLQIVKRIMTDIDNVSDITLTSILKILRYSVELNVTKGIDALLTVLESQVENRSLLTLTHIALAQTSLLMSNNTLMQKILDRFEKEIEDVRLKDIERITFSLYLFNYNPESTPFYKIAAQELQNPHRRSEISKFTAPYVYTALFMLKANYFPEKIVNQIMSPEFINKFCNNDISTLDREYLDISYCLKIDHPEYQGPQLRKDQLIYLLKKFGVLKKKELNRRRVEASSKLMLDVSHLIKLTLGSESAIHLDYLLPYNVRQYIVMCYNRDSKSYVPPGESISQIPLGDIKYAPKDGNHWIVIVPVSHNIMVRNTYQPSGMLALQMRHLKAIGYLPVLITHNVWDNLNSNKDKKEFIRHTLRESQSKASE